MTAEIAIMNKEAIALAADSAVTMSQEREQKVFTSANKLFSLSKYHPVGILVYGIANFMGVPWETIVKIYRNKLGRQRFDTLEEYADNFIAFLDNGNPLFPASEQERYLCAAVDAYFRFVREEIIEKVTSTIGEKGEVTDEEVKQITSDIIRKHYEDLEKVKNLPSIPKNYIKGITAKYGTVIDDIKKRVFEKLPISKNVSNQLKKIAACLFSKEIFSSNISGIVIAGFGEKETFPSLKSLHVEAIVNNKLKYKEEERTSVEITFENSASIIPFAQSEMVATFMEGTDPGLQKQMEGYLSEIFDRYPEIIVDNIEKYNANEKGALKVRLKDVSNKIFEDYKNRIKIYGRENYVDPVIGVVTVLPKDELAAMAEALVSLTSFKRKVTVGTETVGGPIDVAVISKGDGFVWIKRKHYFKPELNPQFFANYYREVEDGNK